ncbi:hypothetical protein PHJA_002515600 [Phtheirospermum japonicum]|uniref:Uncharacterized protein n=1 Tax=Phtheirospermum japonicum TaxID=374723 RepID=A0A830CT16_9LAMI|nr:hypothetical protein PHJA_002515600 [Phtheirospermum japonicum]
MENEKLQQEQMLDQFWKHPPALDTKVVGQLMQLIWDHIPSLEYRRRASLNKEKELIVRPASLGGQGNYKNF